MTSIQPYTPDVVTLQKERINDLLSAGKIDAAYSAALKMYPGKRAALENAYRNADDDLFREIVGIELVPYVAPLPEYRQPIISTHAPQYQPVEQVDYMPMLKGAAALGGVAVIVAVAAKVVMVIVTGAMVGLSMAVATMAEYGFYIVGTIVVLYVIGFALRSKSASVGTDIAEKEESIIVNVNIHSNNKYGNA